MATTDNLNSQTLLIDADDTLWENNIYFERAIANFISFLAHKELSPAEVRGVLNDVERGNILKHGYGLHSFAHALTETFERLSLEPITPTLHQTIQGFAHTIAEHPVEIIAGVEETLAYLQARHHLIIMTKGNSIEQNGKIERSELNRFFNSVEIVAEKDLATYAAIIEMYSLDRETTWMVGNSPKSDINPSLAAGINAVFVPHDNTWILEHEGVTAASPGRILLRVERFSDLRKTF